MYIDAVCKGIDDIPTIYLHSGKDEATIGSRRTAGDVQFAQETGP